MMISLPQPPECFDTNDIPEVFANNHFFSFRTEFMVIYGVQIYERNEDAKTVTSK